MKTGNLQEHFVGAAPCAARSSRLVRRKEPIRRPPFRIVSDVILDSREIPVITNDMIVVAALPNRSASCAALAIDSSRRGALHLPDQCRQTRRGDAMRRPWSSNGEQSMKMIGHGHVLPEHDVRSECAKPKPFLLENLSVSGKMHRFVAYESKRALFLVRTESYEVDRAGPVVESRESWRSPLGQIP
jgi:hypothetical protein